MKKKIILAYNTAWYLYNLRSEFIRECQRRKYEVVAVTPLGCGTEQLEKMGVRCLDLPIASHGVNPIEDLKTYLAFRAIYRREKPDVVFHFTIKPVIYGSLAAKTAKIQQCFSMVPGLGYIFSGDTVRQRILRNVVLLQYRYAMRCNKRIFFQNRYDRDLLIGHGLLDHKTAVVLAGSGVNIRKYQPCEEAIRSASFLVITRLLWEKGIAEYVEAARSIKEKYPKATFEILGPFDRGPSHIPREKVREWMEEGTIIYHGTTTDVRPILGRSAVFVLPSYYREGVPRSILEALAMGKPIITTDWPGCRETVQNGKNGFLVPVKDSAALAEAMERFINDPSLIERMGLHSREIAVQRYDVKMVNNTILSSMGIEGKQ